MDVATAGNQNGWLIGGLCFLLWGVIRRVEAMEKTIAEIRKKLDIPEEEK